MGILLTPCSITSGAVRNLASARVSVPSLLVPQPDRPEGSQEIVWRTDLVATAPYWEGERVCPRYTMPELTDVSRMVSTPLIEFLGGEGGETFGASRTGTARSRAHGGTDVSLSALIRVTTLTGRTGKASFNWRYFQTSDTIFTRSVSSTM